MGFIENVALLREPGDAEIPPSIYDDLTTDYTTVVEGGQAKAAELEAANAVLVAEVARLKAMNFDLLTATGDPVDGEQVENDESGDDDDAPTIESLFTKDGE